MTHFRVIADLPFGVDYVVRYYGNLNISCSSIAMGLTVYGVGDQFGTSALAI